MASDVLPIIYAWQPALELEDPLAHPTISEPGTFRRLYVQPALQHRDDLRAGMLVCKAWRHALQPLLASLLVIGNAIEASQVKALMGLSDRFVDVETVVLGQTTVHAWAAHARLLEMIYLSCQRVTTYIAFDGLGGNLPATCRHLVLGRIGLSDVVSTLSTAPELETCAMAVVGQAKWAEALARPTSVIRHHDGGGGGRSRSRAMSAPWGRALRTIRLDVQLPYLSPPNREDWSRLSHMILRRPVALETINLRTQHAIRRAEFYLNDVPAVVEDDNDDDDDEAEDAAARPCAKRLVLHDMAACQVIQRFSDNSIQMQIHMLILPPGNAGHGQIPSPRWPFHPKVADLSLVFASTSQHGLKWVLRTLLTVVRRRPDASALARLTLALAAGPSARLWAEVELRALAEACAAQGIALTVTPSDVLE